VIDLERLAFEIAGVGVLCGIFWGFWLTHNHTEQTLGAQHCIMETTEVKTAVVADNSQLVAAHAAQLTQVVAVYEQKLADSAGANADLARRLRDNAVRQSAAAGPGPVAAPGAADRGLHASESAAHPRPDRIAADTADVLDACDADHAKVTIVTQAYNDWRQRMIDANARR
jgi:hypothetical protein